MTSIERTLIDLAAVVPADILEETLDDALRRRLTSLRRLQTRIDQLTHRGRAGIGVVRALLEERRPGSIPESALETQFLRMLRRARLPLPAVQYEIRERGRFIARVDFAYPDAMLAIEVDGYRHHSGRARFEQDRVRINALTALGWRVIHATWAQLRNEPDRLIDVVARALTGSRTRPSR